MKLIKPIAVICASFLLVTALYSEESTTVDSNYDAELAKKLGGDQYDMKNYVLILLKTGPKDGEVTGQARADIFSGHMKNIGAWPTKANWRLPVRLERTNKACVV